MPQLGIDVKINGNTSGFNRSMDRTKDKVGGLSAALGGMKGIIAAAFSVSAVTNFTKEVLKSARAIEQGSLVSGTTQEEFQYLQFIGRRAGVDEQEISDVIVDIAERQRDALAGNKDMIKNFKDMGVALKELDKIRPAKIFEEIGVALNQAGENMPTMVAIAKEIAGEGIARIAPVFRDSPQELRKRYAELGGGLNEEQMNKLIEADRIMSEFSHISSRAGSQVVAGTIIGAQKLVTGGSPSRQLGGAIPISVLIQTQKEQKEELQNIGRFLERIERNTDENTGL